MTKILQKKAFLWAGQLINRRIEIKCQQIITDKKNCAKMKSDSPKKSMKKISPFEQVPQKS